MTRSNQQRIRWLATVVAAIVGVGIASVAVTDVTVAGVRNRISQKVRSRYQVENLRIGVIPFESDYWTERGRFKAIVVAADKVSRKGINIRKVYIKAFDVVLDIAQLYEEGDVETVSRQNTALSARVYKSDLNKLLAKKKSAIQNLHIEFQDNQLVVTGKYQLLFGHSLRMVGVLKVEDHRRINFVPTRASVNGIPLPAGPLRGALSKLNPLIDCYKLPLRPRVDKAEIHSNYVQLKG